MPILTDIATVTVGKTRTFDVEKSLIRYARNLYRPPLSIKNKLKTTLNVGTEENLGKITLPSKSKGIFASWNEQLNYQSKTDIFQSEPLNTVKNR